MAYLVKNDSRVISDIEEALSYYDDISIELGKKFESELFIALNKIENHPQHYFNLDQKLRRVNLVSFPYKLVYYLKKESKEIIVLGLFHHYKDPKQLHKRQ